MTNALRGIVLTVFFGWLTLGISLLSASEGTSVKQYYASPKTTIEEINKRGARGIVAELYSHPNEWNAVLRNIASGDKSWLRVAVALHPGSDAGSSEMLTNSVGKALENAPENVFKIASKEFQLSSICGAPDLDDDRYNSYTLAINAIDLRQNKISTIANPELSKLGKKCIQLLEASKADVKSFYDAKTGMQK